MASVEPCPHLEVVVADELDDDQLGSCGQVLVVRPAGAQQPQQPETGGVAVQLAVEGRRQTGTLGGTQAREERRPGRHRLQTAAQGDHLVRGDSTQQLKTNTYP